MEEIIQRMKALLDGHGIVAEITGRPKHIYSIYKKMEQKNRSFEMLRDIRAVRLIVPDIPTCYSTLGLIHTAWRPISHEFDDYIAAPKDNFYRSLHTAVLYDDNKPVEVQIRTPEMHESAEYGIAAHWRYKEGNAPVEQTYEQRITWLRKLMEWRKDVDDAQEFVEGMKSDVLQDRVYVFTPRGDIIDLPAGATPIDFAYHVHTDIGHRCRGAKVDGKLVPLDHALKTGDRVEILTSKTGGPSRDWLNAGLGLVKTQGARAKIRVWFKKQNKGQNVAQGRELIEHELQRLALSEINLEELARELDFKSAEDMYESIGRGDTPPARIVRHLSEKIVSAEQVESIPISAPKSVAQSSDAVQVLGLKGILTVMGKCCHPMPGDEIVGYVTRGRGATIHRQDCPSVLNMSPKDRERLVRVDWGEAVRTYPVPVRITAFDRHGLMGDITNLLNNEGINIVDVRVHVDKNQVNADVADLRLVLEVKDIEQLSRVLARMEKVPNVMEAQRVNNN
jgi:GTP pyrophosphokinase